MKISPSRALALVACLAALTLVGGCSCWRDPLGNTNASEESGKKPETLEEMEARRRELQDKQDEKPDFETVRLNVLPADDSNTKNQVKPGHWFSAVQTMKANNFDFPKGELEAQCVDNRGAPIPLPGTQFDLSTARPVSLPKGQQKHFDLLLFANMPPKRGAINFMTRLRPRGGGREVDWKHEATTRMKPFQNHLVVLADRPDNYQFVKALRSVKPERSSQTVFSQDFDYFVKLPKGTRRVDLPSHSLTWSNLAYVIWDDFEPEILNPSQQQAMTDWLHWGGQLIVNGPKTLDRLRSSVFADYLPARSKSVTSISDDQLATLNQNWSFESLGGNLLEVKDEKDRPAAVQLELTEGSWFVDGTAELIAERPVGRGRVVTTAFNIPHSVFLSWDGYDSLINACLFGRPARRFRIEGGAVIEHWNGVATLQRDDPRLTSSVRYFSRDAMSLTARSKRTIEREQRQQNASARQRQRQVSSAFAMSGTIPKVHTRGNVTQTRIPAVDMTDLALDGVNLSNSPAIQIDVDGPRSMQSGDLNELAITIKNSSNTVLTDVVVEIGSQPDLKLTMATAGFARSPGDALTWRFNPIPPEAGNTLKVDVLASPEPAASNPSFQVRVSSNQHAALAVCGVTISGLALNEHEISRLASDTYGVHGFAKDDLIGVAGWSDKSDVSQAARDSLQRSAGITVPSIDFIAKVLGIYLAILVPVNWLLFKLIGRVEWAWAAVPIISIGGALGVVQAAQLDIGFARSRTEIAVVELQPNYDRAHVTRYIGFYTSLTSRYEIGGEDESTLIQPFASSQPISDRKVAMYQGDRVSLSGFSIISNSTGLVHGEQMTSLGGAITLGDVGDRIVVRNDTDYDLQGAAIVRRNEDDLVEAVWVGDLAKKTSKNLVEFQRLASSNVRFEEWDTSAATSEQSVEGDLNIRRLMEIATDPQRLGRGETLLIGWNDQVMPGVVVRPAAAQVTARTLFVAQLSHAARPTPTRDANSFAVLHRDLKARSKDNPDALSF